MEADLDAANSTYDGHRYNDPFLREGEPQFLVHSTPMSRRTVKYYQVVDYSTVVEC